MAQRKLSKYRMMIVCKWRAEGHSYPEILKFIKDDFGVEMKVPGVQSLVDRPKWRPVVKKYKEEYTAKLMDTPVANKRTRMDNLEYVRGRLMMKLRGNDLKTIEDKVEFRKDAIALKDILIAAREEIEGKGMIGSFHVIGEFGDRTDDELIARRDELLRQAEKLTGGFIEGTGHVAERIEATDIEGPSEILLAAPKEL